MGGGAGVGGCGFRGDGGGEARVRLFGGGVEGAEGGWRKEFR